MTIFLRRDGFTAQARFDRVQSDYLVSAWQVEEGLPQNTITSITQSPDGYLWLGTFDGLVRFDGIRFTVFDPGNTPELKNSRVGRMYKDRAGQIWITSDYGDLTRLSAGTFKAFTARDGMPLRGLEVLAEDRQGRLWGMPRALLGAYRLEGGKFAEVISRDQIPTDMVDPLGAMFGLVGDSEGNLWGGQVSDLVHVYPGYPARFAVEASPGKQRVIALGPSRDGGIWVATPDGAHKFHKNRWETTLASDEEILTASTVLEDKQGQIWVGTWGQGLFRLNPNGERRKYTFTDGPSPEAIRSLFEDSEGNIWAGIQGSGLRRLKQPTFKTYDTRDGLAGSVVRSVTEDKQGNIWVASQGGVDRLVPSPIPVVHPLDFPPGMPWSVMATREGPVFLGTFGRGCYRYSDGVLERITFLNELGGEEYMTLFEDSQGEVWGGFPDNLLGLIRNSVPSLNVLDERDGPKNAVMLRAVSEDNAGRLYAGTDGKGLWRRDRSQWTRIAGLTNDWVKALCTDSDNGLWISTAGGRLSWLKNGRFFNFTDPSLSLPRVISCILEDDNKHLWLGSNGGIYRIPRHELEEFAAAARAAVTVTRYSQSEGLGTIECSSGRQPVAWKAHDGRLWFATAKGVSVVDPAHLPFNPAPPAVVIEKVSMEMGPSEARHISNASQVSESGGVKTAVTLAPGTERLEIHYTGLSFTAPERIRFKYCLQGLDRDWVEAGSARAALYPHLPPGEYFFRVIASNSDGVWNERGATLGVTMQPWFWQTWWCQAGAILSLAGIAFWIYRWRLGQMEALTRLRLRIAGDLHDEIGANLGSIGLNTELLQHDPSLSSAQRQELEDISQLAGQTGLVVRDIVWFTNPDFDNLGGMMRRMREVATLMLGGKEYTFDGPSNEEALRLTIEFRRNVFFMFKEVLHNVVKHSGAKRIEIRISFDSKNLRVSVRDNGCGFETREAGGGSGLKSLKRRARELNGHVVVQSIRGAGTTVSIEAPLRSRREHRLWPWRRAPGNT